MNGWDMALLAIGIYVAVVGLARLMIHRRDTLWAELQAEAQQEQRRRKKQQQVQAEEQD
jgi:hypothetical protein